MRHIRAVLGSKSQPARISTGSFMYGRDQNVRYGPNLIHRLVIHMEYHQNHMHEQRYASPRRLFFSPANPTVDFFSNVVVLLAPPQRHLPVRGKTGPNRLTIASPSNIYPAAIGQREKPVNRGLRLSTGTSAMPSLELRRCAS